MDNETGIPATGCTRSHPHEEMSYECELKTEIATLKGDIRCMVLKAAAKHLPAYREQGDKLFAATIRAEKAEADRDEWKDSCCDANRRFDKAEAEVETIRENFRDRIVLEDNIKARLEANNKRLREAVLFELGRRSDQKDESLAILAQALKEGS